MAALALSLGGCAGLGLPFTGAETTASLTAYNGRAVQPILASAVVANQADPTDWDTIRRTIEGAPQGGKLEWSNAITGSAGSLTVAADTGETCRAFVTTINDVRGIRRYRGQACVTANGRAQLQNVTADDATLT
ncbi:MAG TPA: RT0821/Lpp0805 family surface protein [Bauldia sp.]|nr:RT0821/Lpp0805 family surface protein [Bauldia sp.]